MGKMFYNIKFRYVLLGLMLVNAFIFIIWQASFSHLEKSIFCCVNYLIFIFLFLLIFLFLRSMLNQRKMLLQELEQMVSQNEQNLQLIESLRKEIDVLQQPLRQEEGTRGAAMKLLSALRATRRNDDGSKGAFQFVLNALSQQFDLCCGLIYYKQKHSNDFFVEGRYAIDSEVDVSSLCPGEGLSGQVLKDGIPVMFRNVPTTYLKACSGLGESYNMCLYILPIEHNGIVEGVVELGSFNELPIIAVWNELKDELSSVL